MRCKKYFYPFKWDILAYYNSNISFILLGFYELDQHKVVDDCTVHMVNYGGRL